MYITLRVSFRLKVSFRVTVTVTVGLGIKWRMYEVGVAIPLRSIKCYNASTTYKTVANVTKCLTQLTAAANSGHSDHRQ